LNDRVPHAKKILESLNKQQKEILAKIIFYDKASSKEQVELLENIAKKLPENQPGEKYSTREEKMKSVIKIFRNAWLESESVKEPPCNKENWTPGNLSPCHPRFLKFIKQLKNELFTHGIITSTTDKALEQITKSERLAYIKRDLGKQGKRFNISEKSLDLWYVRIENAILTNNNLKYKFTAILNVQKIFHHYYSISGYTSMNPLYKKARLMIFKIGEILLKEGVIRANTENELIKLLNYNCTDLYKELKFDKLKSYNIQRKNSPIKSLHDAIRKNIDEKNLISEFNLNMVYNIVDEFAVKLLNHDGS